MTLHCVVSTTHYGEILSYEFIISLVVWYGILFQINIISKLWQKVNMDLSTAIKHFWLGFVSTGRVLSVSIPKHQRVSTGLCSGYC